MPQVVITVINYGFLGFCEMSLLALTPLMWSTSLEHGGLGFTPSTIGLTIAVYGILSTFFQATVVGKVVRCFGPRKVFIGGFVPMLVSISCFPLEGYLARRTGHTDWRVWTVIIVHLVMYCLGTASYSAMQVLITDSAPCQSALGSVNGLAQAVGSVSRALAPSFASSLFAVSLQRNWAGGNAVYYILIVIVAYTIRLSLMLPKELHLK
ncbi:hypothetical protein AX14_010809 [Amanita brunnescens Koide BX004]|nr:hypothetical protein AX14_010809 [Amanita brunnescens Koide BX004]